MVKAAIVLLFALVAALGWQTQRLTAAHAEIARLVPALQVAEQQTANNARAARDLAGRLHQCLGEARVIEQRALDAAARVAEADAARAQAEQDADAARAALAAADAAARDFFAHAVPVTVSDRWRAAL